MNPKNCTPSLQNAFLIFWGNPPVEWFNSLSSLFRKIFDCHTVLITRVSRWSTCTCSCHVWHVSISSQKTRAGRSFHSVQLKTRHCRTVAHLPEKMECLNCFSKLNYVKKTWRIFYWAMYLIWYIPAIEILYPFPDINPYCF